MQEKLQGFSCMCLICKVYGIMIWYDINFDSRNLDFEQQRMDYVIKLNAVNVLMEKQGRVSKEML